MKVNLIYSPIYDKTLFRLTDKKIPFDNYFQIRKNICNKFITQNSQELKELSKNTLKKLEEVLGISLKEDLNIYFLSSFHTLLGLTGISNPITLALNRNMKGKTIPLNKKIIKNNLIHELAHVIQKPLGKTEYYEDLEEKHGINDLIVKYHVLTFSLIKQVVGDEEYYSSTKNISNPKYKEALNLVEKIGSEKIIEEAKEYL